MTKKIAVLYLIVEIHGNHVDVGTLFNFGRALHAKTHMADASHGVRFAKLFLHHFVRDVTEVECIKNPIFCTTLMKCAAKLLKLFTFFEVQRRIEKLSQSQKLTEKNKKK